VQRLLLRVEPRAEQRNLELIESVRCLECGVIYSKPARGGTFTANPGCPKCGYLGWIRLSPLQSDELRPAS
jgi:predicted  nucleic acid-binding Zn-ribbon protein